MDPAGSHWEKAEPVTILLNRAPRVYASEPKVERKPPDCMVRAIQVGNQKWFRIRWKDATVDDAQSPPPKKEEGGDPDVLYKKPTGHTDVFADAMAIMMPETWAGSSFPSLMMGDQENPVILYYWNASRGAEVMRSTGRSTPAPIQGKSVEHRTLHDKGHWNLVIGLSNVPESYPLAFALWDGHEKDRDGLKFFSIWYVPDSVQEEMKK